MKFAEVVLENALGQLIQQTPLQKEPHQLTIHTEQFQERIYHFES